MALIEAKNLGVTFPVYGAAAMSIRNSLISQATGGKILSKENKIVNVDALSQLSFTAKPGDRLGLTGHNGAGKSTLLRTLAGIYHPTTGKLKVRGKRASILSLGTGLEPKLTGKENIIRMSMFYGASYKHALQICEDVEEFAELGDFINLPVSVYSNGMTTRLTFGVATVVESDILLVDEVIGAGDGEFKKKAQQRLDNIILNTGIFVVASHSNDIINRLCNRILHFEKGKIVEDRKI